MYRIWFERTMPEKYAHLMTGVAQSIGAANETPQDPLINLPQAQGVVASSYISYDGDFMDKAPELRVIARTGIGINNVDVAAATARNIAVCYTPEAPTISTAEHTIALMFAVAKLLKQNEQAIAQGVDTMYFSQHNALELFDRTLGLVGLGRIGRHVAKIAAAVGMTVIGHDPFVTSEQAQAMGVQLQPALEDLLRQADVVSLHVPLMPETQHLINEARLAQMKPGAILINAARGGLVDEVALAEALDQGQLRGAGLDVFVVEPVQPDHPLLSRTNVVATPHIASATTAGKDRLWGQALTQVLQVLAGERPPHCVNPEIWG